MPNLPLNKLALITAVLSLWWTAIAPAGAAPDRGKLPVRTADHTELVVFEVRNCGYCQLLRQYLAAGYMLSPRAKTLPMRFVDVNAIDRNRLKLRQPLTMVPTIVLMRNGREVERVTGYATPEVFQQLLSRSRR